MQAHAGAGNWLPVDYAPHLWREYQELVLGHEMRYRLGMAWTESSARDLRDLAADTPEGGFDKRTIRGRLADAKARFEADEAKALFKGLPEKFRIVEDAVKLKDELVLAAPYYVRWCARSAIVSPDNPPPLDDIAALVGKKLPDFIDLLEKFEEGNAPASPSADIDERLKELGERKDELENLRAKIDRSGLESEPKGSVGRIESLLATPLLSAPSRMKLLEALGSSRLGRSEAQPQQRDPRDAGAAPSLLSTLDSRLSTSSGGTA